MGRLAPRKVGPPYLILPPGSNRELTETLTVIEPATEQELASVQRAGGQERLHRDGGNYVRLETESHRPDAGLVAPRR
jgi:hypothetical protein